MSFDGIRVDHGVLDQASNDLGIAAQRISGRLDQLEAELRPLRTQWSGQAQESYRVAQAAWDQAMVEMVLLLRQISTDVASSNMAYRQADQRGASRFG